MNLKDREKKLEKINYKTAIASISINIIGNGRLATSIVDLAGKFSATPLDVKNFL